VVFNGKRTKVGQMGNEINDQAEVRGKGPPIETRLLRCLRAWRVVSDASIVDNRSAVQEIGELLEWYICDCLSYGPSNLGGWWSDGVIHLEIDNPETDRFKLLGVTWIASFGIAPFEIDLELNPQDDLLFAKTVFRIGMLNDNGLPIVSDRNLAITRVLEIRPRHDRDWAMAVELTPSTQHAASRGDLGNAPFGRNLE